MTSIQVHHIQHWQIGWIFSDKWNVCRRFGFVAVRFLVYTCQVVDVTPLRKAWDRNGSVRELFGALLPASGFLFTEGWKAPTSISVEKRWGLSSTKRVFFFQALMAMCACCRLRCLGTVVTGLILKFAGFHWPRVARLMGVVQRWLEDACVRHAQNLPTRAVFRVQEIRGMATAVTCDIRWHKHYHLCMSQGQIEAVAPGPLGISDVIWTVRRNRDCSDCEIECPTGVRSKLLRCIQHFPLWPGKKWWDYHVTQAARRVAQYYPGAVSQLVRAGNAAGYFVAFSSWRYLKI